jgi:hypothetical protein
MRTLISLLAALAFSALSLTVNAQTGCGAAVAVNGGTIEVASVQGDDSGNIQCALNAAADGGYGTVFLTSPRYEIGDYIFVDEFTGELRGVSKANTLVQVQDGYLACNANETGVLEFSNGSGVVVRNMTIEVGSPCVSSSDAVVISFISDPDNCAQRTTFGNVDRVVIRGQGVNASDFVYGVAAFRAINCDSSLLGTLKVNRSDFETLDFGVYSQIVGSGQVDINFNTFARVGVPINTVNAAQSTTILGNTIDFNDEDGYDGDIFGRRGILLISTAGSPASNSTTIKNNTFRNQRVNAFGIGIGIEQQDTPVDHDVVITGNRFVGATGGQVNDNGAGIALNGMNDTVISGNTFQGGTREWIYVDGSSARAQVSGVSILSNNFAASTADIEIQLLNTTDSIIGPAQNNPGYFTTGGNNTFLDGTPEAAP